MVHDYILRPFFSFSEVETDKDGQVQKEFDSGCFVRNPPNKKRTRKQCAQSQYLDSCFYIYMHNLI